MKPRAAPAPKGSGTAAGAADPEGGVVPLGDDVTPSRRVSGVPASYPDVARRLRLAGTVTVSMVISGDGEPLEVRVVESGGDILDQAVLDAVATWRFDPARRDGKAVRVRWTVRQTFRFSR